MASMSMDKISNILNFLFNKYNRKEYIHPDPLEFLYRYQNIEDREIVGLISSSLAYGRVAQILNSVSVILEKMGPSPYSFVKYNSYSKMYKIFKGFRYRFDDGKNVAALLFSIKKVLYKFGSLNNCFKAGFISESTSILPCLIHFVSQLSCSRFSFGHLIPDPNKKSACKRLNLFLRWMLRHDDVDPGGWSGIPISMLIVPLDTHMHNIGLTFGFTKRSNASFRTATEITYGFKQFAPDDPVKYDFSLTRPGILNAIKIRDLLDPKWSSVS